MPTADASARYTANDVERSNLPPSNNSSQVELMYYDPTAANGANGATIPQVFDGQQRKQPRTGHSMDESGKQHLCGFGR